MPLPTSGDTWANILQPNLQPTAVRKGLITDILIRDYIVGGVANNLAAAGAGLNANGVFTPFAQDGNLRKDLLITAPGVNQGFFHMQLLKDDGWTFTPDVTTDKTPVAQSVWSVRNDIQSKSGEVMFVARQWFPLLSILQMELPTVNAAGQSIVPDIGTAGYSLPAPAYQALTERQIIALGVDNGYMFSYTFPRLSTKKLGKVAANKKDPMDREFSFEVLLDPFTQAPYIESAGGPSWVGLGGAPVFGAVAPTATPVTGLKVTLSFPVPTGLDVSTVTYTATKTTGGNTTSLALQGSPSISNGTVTLVGTGLSASTSYTANVVATGDNNAASTSLPTASFTSTAS